MAHVVVNARLEAGKRNDSPVVIAIRIHIQEVRAARRARNGVDRHAIPPLGEVWD